MPEQVHISISNMDQMFHRLQGRIDLYILISTRRNNFCQSTGSVHYW